MATQVRLLAYGTDSVAVEDAVRAAFERMEQIDSLLSDYRQTSEVSRLAAQTVGVPVSVSAELATVMKTALRFSRETEGGFDVTIGALTKLWRDARRRDTIARAESICAAQRSGGWTHVQLDTVARTLQFAVAGMQLDFGGIAKGYAADEALAVLREHGVTRAFIEFGGEIVASDPPPGETGWPVSVDGIAKPELIANSALSTSGDEWQYIEVDGVRYSHVVDPRTGWALTNRVTATVRAPTGMIADALATSVTVLDSTRAAMLVANYAGAGVIQRIEGAQRSAVAADPCHLLRGRTGALPR